MQAACQQEANEYTDRTTESQRQFLEDHPTKRAMHVQVQEYPAPESGVFSKKSRNYSEAVFNIPLVESVAAVTRSLFTLDSAGAGAVATNP